MVTVGDVIIQKTRIWWLFLVLKQPPLLLAERKHFIVTR